MSAVAVLAQAVSLIRTATEVADLATNAIHAANNGDQETADKYLAQAREQYAEARRKWDAA